MNMSVSTTAITSLAILMVNFDEKKKNYLQAFVPMLAECLRVSSSNVVSVEQLQSDFKRRFGMNLPSHVIRRLVKILINEGYAFREHNGTVSPNRQKLDELQFSSDQERVVQQYETTVEKIIEFAKESFNFDWTHDTADEALASYISENQVELLEGISRGNGSLIPRTHYPEKSAKYVIASFVRRMLETSDTVKQYLIDIVKGNLLANVVYLSDIRSEIETKWKTAVYFDTRFLIDALGYGSEHNWEPRKETLTALHSMGASLYCFEHTKDEIVGILFKMQKLFETGRTHTAYGLLVDSIEHMKSRRFGASDLALTINGIEQELHKVHISVTKKPSYEEHRYVIDEKRLGELLTRHMRPKDVDAPIDAPIAQSDGDLRRLQNDIDSISAIARIRRERSYFMLEDCGAVFVTSNIALIKGAHEFFNSEPLRCISDYTLANLVWLRLPNTLPNLPQKRIIADCYAALKPSEYLWELYADKVETLKQRQLISSYEYYHYRYSQEARLALMEVTYGDEDLLLVDGNVDQIIAKAQEKLRHEAELAVQSELRDKEIKNRYLESEVDRVNEARRIQDASDLRRREHVVVTARKWARRIIYVPKQAAWIVLLISGVLALPLQMIGIEIVAPAEFGLRLVIGLILIVALLWYVINLRRGVTVGAWFHSYEVTLSKWIEKKLLELSGLNK